MAPNYDLDLDSNGSIKKYESSINTNFKSDTIYKLIELIRKHGSYIGIMEYNGIDAYQYSLKIKYLQQILTTVFEHDTAYQHLYIILYNRDRTRVHLKIYLSIADDPIINYIEKDESGLYPGCNNLKPGEYLINFAHCLINYIGFVRVRLDDDSRYGRTKLWLYSLITKGKSWYTKFGYYPAIVSESELELKTKEVEEIKLNEVAHILHKIIDIDPEMSENFSEFLGLIGDSKETIKEYTQSHSIYEFGNLTNLLFACRMPKKYSDKEIIFDWVPKLEQLRIANVQQVNNCIDKFYAKVALSDPEELSK